MLQRVRLDEAPADVHRVLMQLVTHYRVDARDLIRTGCQGNSGMHTLFECRQQCVDATTITCKSYARQKGTLVWH